MRVVVQSAAIQEGNGAGCVLDKIRRRFPWLELIWADGGHNACQVEAAVSKVPLPGSRAWRSPSGATTRKALSSCRVAGRSSAPSPGSDVRTKPAFRQGFREPAETLAIFVTLASIRLALRRLGVWPGRRS
jgi:hypothetical protein